MTDSDIIKALEEVRYHLTSRKHKYVIDCVIGFLHKQNHEIYRLKKENTQLKKERDIVYSVANSSADIRSWELLNEINKLRKHPIGIFTCGYLTYDVVNAIKKVARKW